MKSSLAIIKNQAKKATQEEIRSSPVLRRELVQQFTQRIDKLEKEYGTFSPAKTQRLNLLITAWREESGLRHKELEEMKIKFTEIQIADEIALIEAMRKQIEIMEQSEIYDH